MKNETQFSDSISPDFSASILRSLPQAMSEHYTHVERIRKFLDTRNEKDKQSSVYASIAHILAIAESKLVEDAMRSQLFHEELNQTSFCITESMPLVMEQPKASVKDTYWGKGNLFINMHLSRSDKIYAGEVLYFSQNTTPSRDINDPLYSLELLNPHTTEVAGFIERNVYRKTIKDMYRDYMAILSANVAQKCWVVYGEVHPKIMTQDEYYAQYRLV